MFLLVIVSDAFGLNAAKPFKAPLRDLQLSGQTLVDGLKNAGLQHVAGQHGRQKHQTGKNDKKHGKYSTQ